jgi:hypothetical protein
LARRRLRAQLDQAVELEARLRAGAAGVELPPVPDIAATAVARLDHRPRHQPRHRRRPLPPIVAACAAVAATVLLTFHALTPAPRADLARFGQRIPVAEARHAASFTALVPPTLNGAYLGRDVPGGRVSLFAGRLLITEFRGAAFPYILSLIGPGTHAELTWVNGRPGVYGSSARALAPGDVLTWLQGPLTLRIEGARTLEQALALARTLS